MHSNIGGDLFCRLNYYYLTFGWRVGEAVQGTIPIPAEHHGSKKSPQTKYQITGIQHPPKRSIFLIKGNINSSMVILVVIYLAA